MSRETRSVSFAELEGLIHSAAQERGVDLDSEKKQVISEIIASAPPQMKPTGLTKWCKRRVEEVLEAHPNLRD